mmetsp:Transcript_18474/g.28347  ORF Transcript_18474/g.28347 Transcript_18474/m.28347 type:complete len:84 (+) Transcript_18474:767-1018(+)
MKMPVINYKKFFDPISITVSGSIDCSDLVDAKVYVEFPDTDILLQPDCSNTTIQDLSTNEYTSALMLTFRSPSFMESLDSTLQ